MFVAIRNQEYVNLAERLLVQLMTKVIVSKTTMNKRILLNTVLALSIPSISVFPAIPVLAHFQRPVHPIQNQQVTIPQSSAIIITFPTRVTFDTGKKNSLPTTAFLAQPLLVSSSSNVDASEVDCNKVISDATVETTEGLRTVSFYCHAQSDNSQQTAPNIQTIPRFSWQAPYWLNGNVCRERVTETVCLTPQEATNLRWPTPSR